MALLEQIKLTSADDFDVSSGNLAIVTGLDSLVQRIRTRLKTFSEECFLDKSLGVPYFQQVFKNKDPRVSALNAAFGDAILSVEGVQRILEINYSLDSATRVLTVNFSVLSQSGDSIDSALTTEV